MMRAFVAIELEDKSKSAIVRASAHMRNTLSGIKWVERENLHITLKFLGDVSDKDVALLRQILDDVGKDEIPFTVSGGFLGAFPSLERARVLFFGIEDGKARILKLFDKLEQKLVKNGFSPDTKAYHPHITVGRSKKRFLDLRKYRETRVEFKERVNALILFKSILTPQGPIYRVIHRGEFK